MLLRKILVTGAAASLLLLPGCAGSAKDTSSGGGSGGGGMIPQLNLPAEVDASVGSLVNYNPYSAKPATQTWLYEPLMMQNSLDCKVAPWLATSYSWESADKLVFTIRKGVKFADGSAFSAKDVAFTFNLAKKYPAMDLAGVWNDTFGAHATSVTAQGDKVVFQFSGPAAPKFPWIIGQKILSAKHYGNVGDPTKYIDKKPNGTGPFKVGSFNGRQLVLVRRSDYWQASKVKVSKLVLEGQPDATQALLQLRTGKLDFYSGEIPNPRKAFVASNPKINHVWYAPNGVTALAPNLKKAPFNDVKFREAMAYAINKQDATLKATYNMMHVASQSGLVMPLRESMLPTPYTAENTVLPFDLTKAGQLLDEAGYKKGAGGLRTNKDGSPLTIKFAVQAGWIDYEAMADSITASFKKLGLNVKEIKSPPDSVDLQKKTGNFDMMVNFVGSGCDYANGLGATLASDQFPTKSEVKGNVERFSDPAVNQAVKTLQSSTDPAAVKTQVGVLAKAMMTQYPVMPILYAPARGIYRTDKAVGWPTEKDPYANPQDAILLIMTHLRPAK
ncbi:ABC transporter substrate-binding protein [Actinopolymorpha rutila]|uniref:Peptide/nickel transport system substrate-binding protein n=1 Tax=Actinopolymorpha rutila TaxID=446787 RepID=A0A852ZET3_9ACTN|nr:ABC transporter substrate-binding protein [Actinopolymorpha rutila]NYH90793.1 peptide/nickel transport system substrate-binding protein [Actinopolymorpha rutila]